MLRLNSTITTTNINILNKSSNDYSHDEYNCTSPRSTTSDTSHDNGLVYTIPSVFDSSSNNSVENNNKRKELFNKTSKKISKQVIDYCYQSLII